MGGKGREGKGREGKGREGKGRIIYLLNCKYFNNKKTYVRTTEAKLCVLITKIVKITKITLYFLFLYCISLKLHCSQPPTPNQLNLLQRP